MHDICLHQLKQWRQVFVNVGLRPRGVGDACIGVEISQTSLAGLKINKGVLFHDYVHATHLYTKGKAEVGRMRVEMGRDEENTKATCRYAAETSR